MSASDVGGEGETLAAGNEALSWEEIPFWSTGIGRTQYQRDSTSEFPVILQRLITVRCQPLSALPEPRQRCERKQKVRHVFATSQVILERLCFVLQAIYVDPFRTTEDHFRQLIYELTENN
ncbi:hypothetical protein HPB50_028749 [Hyalomma asiaticum]|nr:hypothetical protein HPB50_028749 [Hyalomma asiaticum]